MAKSCINGGFSIAIMDCGVFWSVGSNRFATESFTQCLFLEKQVRMSCLVQSWTLWKQHLDLEWWAIKRSPRRVSTALELSGPERAQGLMFLHWKFVLSSSVESCIPNFSQADTCGRKGTKGPKRAGPRSPLVPSTLMAAERLNETNLQLEAGGGWRKLAG